MNYPSPLSWKTVRKRVPICRTSIASSRTTFAEIFSEVLTTVEFPVSVDELAEEIIDQESTQLVTDGGDDKERLVIALQHIHIPMLAAANLICFVRDTKTITGAFHDGE
ncbi:MAG: hypothetical protein U5K37_01825 [Natrialbaceae archaeon]|nr:hypothetical protein [Natrialbaceae archaeon]